MVLDVAAPTPSLVESQATAREAAADVATSDRCRPAWHVICGRGRAAARSQQRSRRAFSWPSARLGVLLAADDRDHVSGAVGGCCGDDWADRRRAAASSPSSSAALLHQSVKPPLPLVQSFSGLVD